MGRVVIGFLAVAVCAMAAALLGVAAARRGWHLYAAACASSWLILATAAVYGVYGGEQLPWWLQTAAYPVVVLLALTAWSVLREREKTRTGEETR